MTQKSTQPQYADNREYLLRAQSGDEEALSRLMENNAGLVRGLAWRFRGRGVELEDLIQIGSIGMLKAIRSFDTSRGTAFSTYAVPLIVGEIRRFLRDDGLIKVGRRQKQLGASLLSMREKFSAEHGREPQLEELAEICGISPSEAAMSLDALLPVHSMSQSIGEDEEDFTLEKMLSGEDPIERRTDQLALQQIIGTLSPLWRQILYYRYFREYSQQATADALGLTQVKISREEKKIFEYLRGELTK